MKTKYDWSGVPEYLNYLAMDADGWVYGYKEKPSKRQMGFDGEFSHYLLKPNEHNFKGNWQDSLEGRPNEFN